MPTTYDDDDDDESNGLSESEYPDEADQDDEDDSADDSLGDCPNCGRPVYYDAEQCPHCRQYITHRLGSDPKLKWIAVAILVAMGLVIIWWLL